MCITGQAGAEFKAICQDVLAMNGGSQGDQLLDDLILAACERSRSANPPGMSMNEAKRQRGKQKSRAIIEGAISTLPKDIRADISLTEAAKYLARRQAQALKKMDLSQAYKLKRLFQEGAKKPDDDGRH